MSYPHSEECFDRGGEDCPDCQLEDVKAEYELDCDSQDYPEPVSLAESIQAWGRQVFQDALEAEDEEAKHAANLCGGIPTCSLCEVQELAVPMRPRAWTPAERSWITRMVQRYGNLDQFRGEEIERKLDEASNVERDPFYGLTK